MLDTIKSFVIIALIMAPIDYIYLNSISDYFNKMIFNIQKSNLSVKYMPAFFVYLFMTFSIYHFIISKKGTLLDAFILGICIYSVYELTNYALIDKWPLKIVLIDLSLIHI